MYPPDPEHQSLSLSLIMSRSIRRLYSSSSSSPSSASTIATNFLSKSQLIAPQKHTQLLDPNQLQRLSATLSRTELCGSLPENGTLVPPCWHLAYFTPSQIEADLGRDGTDTSFNPPRPFTRRMWAGGELEWFGENKLRIGQRVTESTKLISAEGKKTRTGEEMVVVGVEKRFENEDGVALLDRRNWIFRPEITIPQAPSSQPSPVPLPEGKHIRDFMQTPVTLFRFSALTFNGHKIHYNKEWCREIEGHRDLVVHGPLNLINMVDFWRDVNGSKDILPRKVTYRATSPLYAGEKYRIVMDEKVDNVTSVKIVDSYGNTSMIGRIESL